jgi:hypothetical protein
MVRGLMKKLSKRMRVLRTPIKSSSRSIRTTEKCAKIIIPLTTLTKLVRKKMLIEYELNYIPF